MQDDLIGWNGQSILFSDLQVHCNYFHAIGTQIVGKFKKLTTALVNSNEEYW